VPILMLTAKNTERDTVRALDAGANDFVSKPFEPNALLARVRRLIQVQSA
jgi:DNA-binding response OmpR family regulator